MKVILLPGIANTHFNAVLSYAHGVLGTSDFWPQFSSVNDYKASWSRSSWLQVFRWPTFCLYFGIALLFLGLRNPFVDRTIGACRLYSFFSLDTWDSFKWLFWVFQAQLLVHQSSLLTVCSDNLHVADKEFEKHRVPLSALWDCTGSN